MYWPKVRQDLQFHERLNQWWQPGQFRSHYAFNRTEKRLKRSIRQYGGTAQVSFGSALIQEQKRGEDFRGLGTLHACSCEESTMNSSWRYSCPTVLPNFNYGSSINAEYFYEYLQSPISHQGMGIMYFHIFYLSRILTIQWLSPTP